MIYNNIFNYGCFPLIAATPFSSTRMLFRRGEVGLSDPNVDLIAFNSGDFDFSIEEDFFVAVGLGVAVELPSNTNMAQLGIVVGHRCILTNFEIAYSGSIVGFSSSDSSIEYNLMIIRATSNDGVDYPVIAPITAFSGIFTPPFDPGQISRNTLITVPMANGTNIIFPGDRFVLFVIIRNVESNSLVVGASVECTPF